MATLEKRVVARIAELEKARDRYVVQANQQVAAFEGAIRELRGLLEAEAPAEPAEAITSQE